MQLQMPFFPTETKLINNTLGFFEKEGLVYYLHNGLPIYCHNSDDENYYRFIAANLCENGLCTRKELATALGVNQKNIDRYVESLRSKGVNYFFNREDNRGQCYKLNENKMEQAQEQLNKEVSVRQIGRELQVTEAAIRHHIKNGKLKKNET